MTVNVIKYAGKEDSDDEDSDDSDDSMQMDVSEGRDVESDDNSSVDIVTQPSKKKKFN